ncbi:hypothetical protein B0H14DRAFT_3777688 [Mycena olivaceomarginata]|nr:hypothetical protein B0H14DRAFT_3777688 [Mycena olivaceomarginata]
MVSLNSGLLLIASAAVASTRGAAIAVTPGTSTLGLTPAADVCAPIWTQCTSQNLFWVGPRLLRGFRLRGAQSVLVPVLGADDDSRLYPCTPKVWVPLRILKFPPPRHLPQILPLPLDEVGPRVIAETSNTGCGTKINLRASPGAQDVGAARFRAQPSCRSQRNTSRRSRSVPWAVSHAWKYAGARSRGWGAVSAVTPSGCTIPTAQRTSRPRRTRTSSSPTPSRRLSLWAAINAAGSCESRVEPSRVTVALPSPLLNASPLRPAAPCASSPPPPPPIPGTLVVLLSPPERSFSFASWMRERYERPRTPQTLRDLEAEAEEMEAAAAELYAEAEEQDARRRSPRRSSTLSMGGRRAQGPRGTIEEMNVWAAAALGRGRGEPHPHERPRGEGGIRL